MGTFFVVKEALWKSCLRGARLSNPTLNYRAIYSSECSISIPEIVKHGENVQIEIRDFTGWASPETFFFLTFIMFSLYRISGVGQMLIRVFWFNIEAFPVLRKKKRLSRGSNPTRARLSLNQSTSQQYIHVPSLDKLRLGFYKQKLIKTQSVLVVIVNMSWSLRFAKNVYISVCLNLMWSNRCIWDNPSW